MRKYSSCSSLLQRIHDQHVRDARNTQIVYIRKAWMNLFFYFVLLLIFQCHNRVYNAWEGPFSMNLNQFRNHLNMNYNLFGFKSFFSFRWFLFQPEYVQIELDKNVIDQNIENTFRVFYGDYSYGKLLYTFNRVVEPMIDTSHMTLFIKFYAYKQSYPQIHYPYRFQSFNVNTLQCIVEQLGISSREFIHWSEKSIYIEKIEQIYKQNPSAFNIKVISKCGIVIGYLYSPTNEYMYPGYSYEQVKFSDHVRVFDASCSYTPYISYVMVIIFIYLLFKHIPSLIRFVINLRWLQSLSIHPSIQKQMKKANIVSLENLDNLLLNTTYENNHYDRLFIVHNKYLVMLMIDLHEKSGEILRRFYEDPPFIIIPIDIISNVRFDYIVLENNNHSQYIYFPTRIYNSHFNPAHWLHQRLMILNYRYRYNWEREKQLCYEEETRRAQKEEQRRRLEFLIEEEAQYQQHAYEHDINRILQGIRSASPRFIAQFRLNGWQIVSHDFLDNRCSICLEDLQLKQRIAQWPCQAKHTFHFDCMLDVLRAGNTCPLCRHPVEAADLPSAEAVVWLILGTMIPNAST